MKLHVNALLFTNIFQCHKFYKYFFYITEYMRIGCSYGHIRQVLQRCSKKMAFFKLLKNSLENTCAEIFFDKVPGWRSATIFKKKLTQMFPCEFWEIFKNTYFVEQLRIAVFLMSDQAEKIISRCQATVSYIVLFSEE